MGIQQHGVYAESKQGCKVLWVQWWKDVEESLESVVGMTGGVVAGLVGGVGVGLVGGVVVGLSSGVVVSMVVAELSGGMVAKDIEVLGWTRLEAGMLGGVVIGMPGLGIIAGMLGGPVAGVLEGSVGGLLGERAVLMVTGGEGQKESGVFEGCTDGSSSNSESSLSHSSSSSQSELQCIILLYCMQNTILLLHTFFAQDVFVITPMHYWFISIIQHFHHIISCQCSSSHAIAK